MVGGEQIEFEEAISIFEAMGKTITLCGPNGAGQIIKTCNQIQVALNFVRMAESLVLGTKAVVGVTTFFSTKLPLTKFFTNAYSLISLADRLIEG